jgi:hypothetical protein
MEESNALSFGTNARMVIDESEAGGATLEQSAVKVVNCKTDVVDAWPTLLEEPADR